MSSNIQKAFKTKSKLRGMANGGIMEENVGGVRTFTDQRAAGSGARPYTPSSTAGSMSVVGMAPAQRAEMDASIAKYRAEAAQAHEQRMGRAPDPTTALANALNKVGTSPTGTTPASAPTSPLRAPARSLPPITVTPPPVTAAAVPQLPTTTVFPPSTAMGGFRSPTSFSEDFYMQTPRFRDGGMHETREYYPHEPMIDGTRGGLVRGPGGPTDDKVGPVMLSDGEYVLPADTVEAVGKENLDALRDATHTFVEPKKPKNGLRGLANGTPSGVQLPDYRDPNGKFRQTPTPTNPSYREAPRPAGKPSGFLRVAGRALVPATAAYNAVTDSPEARSRAASGREGVAGVASQVGSYLGNVLSFGAFSPQDIGATISALRGEGSGAYHAVPDAEKGWARRLGERYFPTESARIMSGRVQLSDDAQARADLLKRHGIDLGNMSEADFARAREILGTPKPPDPQIRTPQIRTSESGPAVGVDPGSYQSRRLAEMGVPVDQQNLAPVTEGTRRSLLREGGGMPGQYVNLGSYGGDANIYGTASTPGGRIDTFTGVGASSRPGGSGPQEDPIMSEIRSALRGLTEGAGNRGGPRFSGRDHVTDAINKRYDALLRDGSGRNRVRGLDWSQRHALSIEAARARELSDYAQNQATLRGQDMQAATAANNANLQARMQALQTLGTMATQRDRQIASAQAAQLKALQDAAAAEQDAAAAARNAELAADERAVKTRDAFLNARFGPHAEGPEGARRRRADQFFNRLPAGAWQQIAELPPTEQNAVLDALAQAMEAQDRDLETGRSPYAVGQNAAIGALTGYGLRGMNPVGRLAQGVTEALGLRFPSLRGKGKAVSDLIGKTPWLNPALGAAAGASLTPSRGAGTQLPDLPRVDAMGNEVSPRSDLDFWLTHGFFADPNDHIFTQGGRTMKRTGSADVDASRKLLREFLNQGR